MTESEELTPVSGEGSPEPADMPSAGAMLRTLRESAGVHLEVLASALKVSPQKLQALESDRYDDLPGLTFARGLASAVARAFGADPAPVLARMPALATPLRARQENLNEPFRRASDQPRPMLGAGLSTPLLLAIGLLLVGAVVLWLWPTSPIQLSSPPAAPAPVIEEVLPEPVLPPAPAPAAEPVAPPADAAPAGADDASQPVSDAVAGEELLRFTATGETWVTVRDAAGKQVLNRALEAGEVVAADGDLPLSVTIGRKDAVRVMVRGQVFDLDAVGRGNVARFQVQ